MANEPIVTRDEFIDGYILRSGIDPQCRTETGFKCGKYEMLALRCNCGYDECMGWAMIRNNPEFITRHNETYGDSSNG